MPWGGGTGDKDKVDDDDEEEDDDVATLIHKQREIWRVMRMRSAERQVSTNAQGPGPSGSAANQSAKLKRYTQNPVSAENLFIIYLPLESESEDKYVQGRLKNHL